MAATSGSDGRAGAAAGSLASLSNPRFASMTAADLVVHLFGVHRASDFADAALVLSVRERSAAAAEARIREAEEVAGRLREELAARALEAEAQVRRAAETEERLRAEIRALERRADEAAGRLHEELAARALEAEAQTRRAAETEERLRAEIHALERRTDEAEARAGLRPTDAASGSDRARGEVGPELGAGGPAADVDRPDDDIICHDDVESTVADAGDDGRAGVEREDGETIEADSADVDPDDTLTLSQYLQKLKLLPGAEGEGFAAESESVSINTVDNDAPENPLHALAVVCQGQENLLPPAAPLLRAVSPTPGSLKAKKTAHVGGDMILKPRANVVPQRATRSKPREKGIIYKMVLEALKEKERIILAKMAAESHSQQPNLRFWLHARPPSESAGAEEDPHGQAPQK